MNVNISGFTNPNFMKYNTGVIRNKGVRLSCLIWKDW